MKDLTPMNHHLTRLIAVLCITFTTLGTLNAAQPRMERAIVLLQRAQDSPNPVRLLQRARYFLNISIGNKAGFRVRAINTIDRAIAKVRRGGDAEAQIRRAIVQVQAGIDNASPAQN